MDRLMSIVEYHTLRMLAERLESSELNIPFDGKPAQINLGKRWDFYIAAADSNALHPEFSALLDSGYIEQIPGKRTYDDWRRHFPEYHFQITEKGRAVLDNPRTHVEVNPYEHRPNIKPDLDGLIDDTQTNH